MECITSRENPRIKRLCRLLAEKKERVGSGLFVTEGARLSWEAASAGLAVEELFLTRRAMERYPEQTELLLRSAACATEIPEELSARVGDTRAPQGVFCVCRTPQRKEATAELSAGKYLALESLQDPGNLGTIVRTADALALDGVVLTDDCPELYAPKVLRSTMGSAFHVPVYTTGDLPALLRAVAGTHATYAAMLERDAVSLRACRFSGSCIAVVGNEGAGVRPQTAQACATRLFVDMPGRAESLNAAVAASILMWEMVRATD